MSIKGKFYEKKYAIELIEIAKGDIESAKGLNQVAQGRPENICYLAQQAVEKSLKAVMCHIGMKIIFTNDIELLISHLPEELIPPHQDKLGELTEYSAIRRYERGYAVLDPKEIDMCLRAAVDVVEWASKEIKK